MTFIGVRTDRFAEMVAFVRALGYKLTRAADGFYAFRTPSGQRLEIFDTAYPDKEHFTTGPVPGFEVADFDRSVDWLRANGYEILRPPVSSSSGTSWVHFRGPDGNVYEFVHHPDLQH